MKAFAFVAAAAALFIVGCGSTEPGKTATNQPAVPAGVTVGDYELGSPIMAGNAMVVPVMYKGAPDQKGDEITLSEAKKLGLVEIVEIPGSEEVNKLRVHNKSDRPLLLLGGELLLGGKQDRIVVHDVIIPPGATQEVDVDCVEHGRWDGETRHFDYSSKIVPSTVRDAAAYGDQSQVWDKVKDLNEASGGVPLANGRSTTIQVTLNSPEVDKKIQADLPRLSKELSSNSKVVGVIFVLNGEIRSMDLFGNPKTFQSTRESLLHSYLSEAAMTKGSGTAKAPAADDYKAFVDESVNGKREAVAGNTDAYFISGKLMKGNEQHINGSAGVPGKFVHGSYSRAPEGKE